MTREFENILEEDICFIPGKDIRKNRVIDWEKVITNILVSIVVIFVGILVYYNFTMEAHAQTVTMTAEVGHTLQNTPLEAWTGGSLLTKVTVIIE